MKKYFKIKENKPLNQNSRSKREVPFLDHEVDFQVARHSSNKTHDQLASPTIDDDHDDDYKGRNDGKSEQLERQGSTRTVQEAMKRAFSIKRSLSSSSSSSKYCRIHDQPMIVDDDNYYDQDDENGRDYINRNETCDETKMMKKNGKSSFVKSKVVKFCKTFFRG